MQLFSPLHQFFQRRFHFLLIKSFRGGGVLPGDRLICHFLAAFLYRVEFSFFSGMKSLTHHSMEVIHFFPGLFFLGLRKCDQRKNSNKQTSNFFHTHKIIVTKIVAGNYRNQTLFLFLTLCEQPTLPRAEKRSLKRISLQTENPYPDVNGLIKGFSGNFARL